MRKDPPEVKDAIVTFISNYHAANGYAPSVREIGQAVGRNSTSTISRHLSALEKDGRIRRAPGMNRAIAVVKE